MMADTKPKGQHKEGGYRCINISFFQEIMSDEEVQVAFLVLAFYMRGDCDWRVSVLSVSASIFLGDPELRALFEPFRPCRPFGFCSHSEIPGSNSSGGS